MSKVAIIGFSFRFPSTDFSRYWDDLLNGRNLVTSVDASRWAMEAFTHPSKTHPGTAYTFAAGSIGDVSKFDADFFGISPREAALMDPQQRLLLEMSWEAMENAGVKPSSLQGSRCGVFIGIASADYSYRMADDLAAIDTSMATGNTASIAANRLSYFYDLRGPSMAIDTACSSSMVAFHQACQSILSGEAEQALAGGVSLHLHPYGFITFSKAAMLSRQGRCRVFDASGDGYVRSEGGGLFLLKNYERALADGDPILAVVAHSAVNTDGHKSGLTVPSHQAQSALMSEAYAQAGIAPCEIDYVEAHGTGTAVGDPIEARSLGEAIGQKRPAGQPLLIGSIKSNLGHLEAASGVAGLVKALYCLRHRTVPATIGLESPNPNIPFDELNLEVATQNRPLKEHGTLTVGVNSFGFGGANAHIILQSVEEQPRAVAKKPPKGRGLPILLSAQSEAGLKASAAIFADFLQGQPSLAFYDIAYTAAMRRERLPHRAVVFGVNPAEVATALRQFAEGETQSVETGQALESASGPAFVYSGNGAQWAAMGQGLLKDPVFRKAIRRVDALFRRHANYSLEDELAGNKGEGRYEHTEFAQPALFAVQVGITEMLRHDGVKPAAVLGHSVGEVAAAWACGALSLEAAVEVVFHRSRLQGTTKGLGQMTAVGLDAQSARGLLVDLGLTRSLHLSGINSPRGVTIAGDVGSLSRLEASLASHARFYKRLDLDYAFHSPAMDNIEHDIQEALAELRTAKSTVPFYSTVTGDLLAGTQLNAEYWWHNVRHPVLFEETVKNVLATGINVFMEIGPHPVLRTYVNDCLKDAKIAGLMIPTVLRDDDDPQRVRSAAGQAMLAGASVDWRTFFPTAGGFVDLPNYPWQRETHWHPITSESLGTLYRNKLHPLLGYALAQHSLTWENQLDSQAYPSLADHVVGEGTVFPGSGFAELALAAALVWQPGAHAEVEDLEIRAPLLLGAEHSKTIRVEIDGQDGTFAIKGREQAGSEALALHAGGRILREPSTILLRKTAPVLPKRPPDFNRHDHESMAKALGLNYGPTYLAISHGWVEDSVGYGLFEVPQALEAELEHYHLHPALLDSAFQLILQILRNDRELAREGIAFVPAKIGRIAFRSGLGTPHLALASLRKRSPHSLLADFSIFDEAGRLIAFIKEARFRSIRLQRGAAEQIRYVEYRFIPKPHLPHADSSTGLPFEQTLLAMKEGVRRCVLKGAHRSYSEEIDPLLDGLCSRFTLEALDALNVGQAALRPSAMAETDPFRGFLLAMLQEDGLLDPAHAYQQTHLAEENQPTAQDIWNSLVADYPDYFKIIHAVGRVGMQLRSILGHSLSLQSVCPQDTSLSTLRRQVLGATAKHSLGKALHDLISATLARLPEGRRFGVLEISEGAPWFALDICPSLDFDRGDYVFASPSASAIEQAGRLKEKLTGLTVQSLAGIGLGEKPVIESPHSFQLAIISTDLLDLRDTLAALDYAKAHLVSGASILLLGQHPSRWIDFVFGGQSEWWSPSSNGSLNSRQQSAHFWQQQLEQLGFGATSLLEFSPDTASGPYLLLGRFDGANSVPAQPLKRTASHWLILADEQGYSAALAERVRKKLGERGENTLLISLGDTSQIGQALEESLTGTGPWKGIIYLIGLNALPTAREVALRVGHQIDRCQNVAAAVQACQAAQVNAPCWIITAGAMADTLPNRHPSGWRASTASFADSALWGFARTLMNEVAEPAVRLIDLEDPYALETVASALDREFCADDDEREVIITGAGVRFVPRLKLKPRHIGRESSAIERTSILRLGFKMPGQLRNLRWEEHPRIVPGKDELEIEVQATGLNFRDVMYALGMLSDEAIENGFAGPSLGLEFAGVVLATGTGTTSFAPGDRVVGFGPSSFSNRVVTQVSAAAHIPHGISFEAAATIPSTFFTAYYALQHLACLERGEKVLIHGAAGGVGIAAIQVAKWCGAEIFATAGTDEKRDFLRLLGVEHVYDSRTLAFADEILADTDDQGVDVILNSLAGEAVNRNLRVLKPFGRFLELGKRDFYENTKIGLRPFRNNLSYFGIDADQLMSEHPKLTGQLFGEVMALFAEGVLHPLPYCAFEAEDVVDAFRYMQQSKQIGKIVLTYRNGISRYHATSPKTKGRLNVSADGAYLITGGLSGFGLKTAQWLAAKGARQLILVGRKGLVSEEAKQAVASMEKSGVRVLAAACDVSDKGQLKRLLEQSASQFSPLKGIIHSAMVIDDGLIQNLDTEQIRRVFEPKILGAQNLHELSLELSLDFFVLFSSATTLFGNPGQGNYVAANTWLEALARHRLGLGLPATSVMWGIISDTGFLARNSKFKEALQSRMGGSALHSSIALKSLEWLLVNGRSGEAVLDFDWKSLHRFLPSAAAPKFSELALQVGDADHADNQAENIHKLLAEFSDTDLLASFAEMLKQEVGEILRVPPDKIDASRAIHLMGLDSLMGVELIGALESRFGIRLPVMALSESPTIDKLAARILAQLRSQEEPEAAASEAEVLSQLRQVAEKHAADVSPNELTRLAEDMQAMDPATPHSRLIQ